MKFFADIQCTINLFADDTSQYVVIDDQASSSEGLIKDIKWYHNRLKVGKWSSILTNENYQKKTTTPVPDLSMDGSKAQIANCHNDLDSANSIYMKRYPKQVKNPRGKK